MRQKFSFTKFFVLGVLVFSLSACSEISSDKNLADAKSEEANQQEETFVVQLLVKSDEEEKNYKGTVTKGESVIDLMQKIQDQGDMKFFKKDSSIGSFVEEINGVQNSVVDNKFWMFYINGESSSVGVSGYEVQKGDLIEWRFEDVSGYKE